MPSYSKYPAAIDDSTSLPLSTDLVTEVKAEVVNRLRDSIIKTQNELGINPSGEYGTVKSRLDTLKLQIDKLLEIESGLQSIQDLVSELEDYIFAANFFIYTCDSSLQVGQAVAHSTNDTIVLADATNENLPAFGLICEKITPTTARVQVSGELVISGLTANQNYFLSEISPGEITLAEPTASGSFIQSLGFAKNNQTFMIQIAPYLIFI